MRGIDKKTMEGIFLEQGKGTEDDMADYLHREMERDEVIRDRIRRWQQGDGTMPRRFEIVNDTTTPRAENCPLHCTCHNWLTPGYCCDRCEGFHATAPLNKARI
jgi:hypothetical protein